MIVTAQRTETRDLDTPATTNIITEQNIKEAGYKNVFDAIEHQVGLTSTGYGDAGQDFGFSSGRTVIRGYDRGTLVMVDGIPMNLKNYNSLDGIPIDMVQQIEIIKGAAGTLYGSEAMAAAVASASKKVRMIFFNACFSQKEAQAVVDKVEAAIGMNTEIGDEAAIVFAAQFYSSIGFGQNLQQAFDQAKAALLLKGIAEENTPVLYVRKGLLAQDIVMVESEALKKSDNVTIMQKIKKFFRDQRILR